MAQIRWQCRACGAIMTTAVGSHPPFGSFCARSKDHKHRWAKIGIL